MTKSKMFSMLLAAVMLLTLSFSAMAEPVDTELEGYITELVEGGFLMNDLELGEIMLNVDDQTVLGGILLENELEVGQYVLVQYDGRTTRSLPPQTHADSVGCFVLNGTVKELLEDGTILLEDELFGEVLVHVNGAAMPIYPGMSIVVYYDGIMAMSMPGQVAAREIVIPELTGTISELDGEGFILTDEEGSVYHVLVTDETVLGQLVPAQNELPSDSPVGTEGVEAAQDTEAESVSAVATEEDADAKEAATADKSEEALTDEVSPAEAEAAQTAANIDITAYFAEGNTVTVYYSGELSEDEPSRLTAFEVLKLAF